MLLISLTTNFHLKFETIDQLKDSSDRYLFNQVEHFTVDGEILSYLKEVFPNFFWPKNAKDVKVTGEFARYMLSNV